MCRRTQKISIVLLPEDINIVSGHFLKLFFFCTKIFFYFTNETCHIVIYVENTKLTSWQTRLIFYIYYNLLRFRKHPKQSLCILLSPISKYCLRVVRGHDNLVKIIICTWDRMVSRCAECNSHFRQYALMGRSTS